MNYDSRFPTAGENALKQRRVAALAAIFAVAAVLGALSLVSAEARAPEQVVAPEETAPHASSPTQDPSLAGLGVADDAERDGNIELFN